MADKLKQIAKNKTRKPSSSMLGKGLARKAAEGLGKHNARTKALADEIK